ncbi:MAG: thiaminase II [Rubrimonas sp.]|uniref:thiaminase II n=1 Tax=Rubrimonas sp. TaxID=2036015 RepID=UPI002FDD5374
MSFTETALRENARLCADIRAMPFNRALADGSLEQAVFQHYVLQDAHYLEGFARALACAAARAPDAEAVAQLSGAAAGAIAVERQLHAHFMGIYGVDSESFAATPPSPVCEHYVGFLVATAATRGIGEAVAALLPCFWIYRDVGAGIHAAASADNPYRAWIDAYAGDEFDAAVARMCALADRLAEAESATGRARMRAAFAKSALLEWMFWDSAWRRCGWPDTAAVATQEGETPD